MTTLTGGCECGAVRFTLTAPPIMRSYCHCTICQTFNASPYADITLVRTKALLEENPDAVDYQAYRPPPNVQRGRCRACGKPAIEHLHLPGGLSLTFVPSDNFDDPAALPAPSMHGFYGSRLTDADDALPKYSGYWRSQLGFGRHLLAALANRNRNTE